MSRRTDQVAIASGFVAFLLMAYAALSSLQQLIEFQRQGALSTAETLFSAVSVVALVAITLADLLWLLTAHRSLWSQVARRALWFVNVLVVWLDWIVANQLSLFPVVPWVAALVTVAAAIATTRTEQP